MNARLQSLPVPESDNEVIRQHLPRAACGYVYDLLRKHPVEVRVVPHRTTKLGDHRPPSHKEPWHRITMNEDLSVYAFLVTLLHEIAHLRVSTKLGERAQKEPPHGQAWQREFADAVKPVIEGSMVPRELAVALTASLQRPRAATCSDRKLLLALSRFDSNNDRLLYVEQLEVGEWFQLQSGRRFVLGNRLRSRYQCIEIESGVEFRIHSLARVVRLDPD
ncbi:MAG: hypothetical protein HOK57_09090 [Planctomycetaceae bacterium]|nr:hypothetical protein [Planctomycetaceae bacterium]MBT4886115.1 hypothetical protein [Planctomycetaceae bacterium]MBT6459967.1 hypothetical protein [Planctomycetaceae bacterium]MBT6642826.1 hypothetical protein [Planctomycetaceae bacterium]MBT6919988.1 hypothetical protein [Planctomycetaceae bacterium]